MTEIDAFQIAAEDVSTLLAMADQAGVDPQTFTHQSLLLGLDLAKITLSGEDPDQGPEVLFEQPDGTYNGYAVDFSTLSSPDDTVIESDLGVLEAAFAAEPLTLVLDPDVLARVSDVTEQLGTDRASFIASCLFYRWKWTTARSIGGKILIRCEDEGDLFEFPVDRFEQVD